MSCLERKLQWSRLLFGVGLLGEECKMTEGKTVMPNLVDELSYSTVRLRCTCADGSISICKICCCGE